MAEIKIRYLSPDVVSKIDDIAKKKGFNSRQEYLKNHLEMISISDELRDKDDKYKILLDKVLKVLEYNTIVLNKFLEENLMDLSEIIEDVRGE